MSDVYAKLQALNITLPPLAAPAAAYVPYVQTGKLLFVSGHLAKKTASPGWASWAKTWIRPPPNKPRAQPPSICWARCTWQRAAI